ncbi:hypothetical protein CHARACLAT_031697 [Characodon lateralis]|uniref:Uncharacterized protein n=1 Tax=Characodon lateralis TaxID=208331 RepID=A0ABU7EP21_9TELE|nr:hypothetical protein [Characodon lateralis]
MYASAITASESTNDEPPCKDQMSSKKNKLKNRCLFCRPTVTSAAAHHICLSLCQGHPHMLYILTTGISLATRLYHQNQHQRGLIYERSVHTKQSLKLAYITVHAKIVIFKKQTRRESVQSLIRTFTHVYARFGDRGIWRSR